MFRSPSDQQSTYAWYGVGVSEQAEHMSTITVDMLAIPGIPGCCTKSRHAASKYLAPGCHTWNSQAGRHFFEK